MAFITDDKRVKDIIADMKSGKITHFQAAGAIRRLPPQKGAEFGYLDWEVEEALNDMAVKP